MAMAMRDEPGFRRMAFALEIEDDWPPVSVETLWVTEAGKDRFRIDSVPFLVPGIAVGDLVAGETDHENVLQFAGKLEGGGHSTIQVILVDDDAGPVIKEELRRSGCEIENSPWPSLFSIDVPGSEALAQARRILEGRAAADELGYENACISE